MYLKGELMRYANKQSVRMASFLIAALMMMPGCMADYGNLKGDPALTDVFLNKEALPEYNYYYNGRANVPYAVIGIDPQYEFQDRVWHRIDTREDVVAKVANIRSWNREWSQGAKIVGPDGKQLGIWFSYYRHTTIKVGPDNQVAVYSPYTPNRKVTMEVPP